MCDYSLASLRSRLAVEGEPLIVHRFPTGSLGFASPAEVESLMTQRSGWRSWFSVRQEPYAVCIPPGAKLLLHDIPKRLQAAFGVGPAEEVTFVQRSADAWRYRDGVRFNNNQEILLQRLTEGQGATVISLTPETTEPSWAEGELAVL